MHTTRYRVSALRLPGIILAAVAMVAMSFIVGGSPSASSHNAVVATTPEAGSTVTDSPIDIRIVTSDQLLDLGGTGSGFAIVVRDADGLYYGDGCVDIGGSDMSTLADLGQGGEYTVTFQFVSADGHSLSDSFVFTFAPTPSHAPATGVTTPPQCGVAPEPIDALIDETTETDPTDMPEGAVAEPTVDDIMVDDQGERGPITLAIAAVLVTLSITLLVWMVRRRDRG